MFGAFKLGGRGAKVAGFVFQLLMFVAIIATANHYVLDALAGALLLVVANYLARKWVRYESRVKQWTAQASPLTEIDSIWRERVSQFELPDLRGPFLSGSTIQGGHATRSAPAVFAVLGSSPANISTLIRPVFYDLSLVLR